MILTDRPSFHRDKKKAWSDRYCTTFPPIYSDVGDTVRWLSIHFFFSFFEKKKKTTRVGFPTSLRHHQYYGNIDRYTRLRCDKKRNVAHCSDIEIRIDIILCSLFSRDNSFDQ